MTFEDVFMNRYGVYEARGYPAYRFSPEVFVSLIRKFVLECKALPQIRTKIAGGRRIEYNGLPAVYLVPWGGTDECQTVILYDVPEDIWVYMDQSRGEWRHLYKQYVLELYGRLSDLDRTVLKVRPWELG